MTHPETVQNNKIPILDSVDPKAAEILEAAGFQVDVKGPQKPDELEVLIGDYVGVIVRSATEIRANIINKATNLKIIGRAGSGTDNIDVDVAKAKGILVMNADGNTISAAEHSLAMMISLARNITTADKTMKNGLWEKKKLTGVELNQKTLGIIGLGKVGRALAERAMGLKMTVIAYDPPLPKAVAEKMGVELIDDLDKLLEKADFISLHTQKMDDPLLTREKLQKCKKGVRIINCARDGLIDPEALLEALKDGTVAGAALDVFEDEPVEKGRGNAYEREIINLSNVIATPHLGASTKDAQIRVAEMIAKQILNYLKEGTIEGAVGIPSLSAEERKKLGPHLMLASYLGSLIGQMMPESRLESIDIDYAGEAAKLKREPLKAACVEWLLKSQNVEVNSINALEVAKDRGINPQETVLSDEETYHTLLRIRVTTDKGTTQIAGTLINNEPRVVSVDNIRLEAKIASHMLFTRTNNKPGMVSTIGRVLESSGINIKCFDMEETIDGKENISFLAANHKISERVVANLKDAGGDDFIVVRALNMSGLVSMNGGPR